MGSVLGVLDAAVTSPWFYLAVFAAAAIDGFFPVVPGESMVITGGVYAAAGEPELAPVIALAALGAFLGDHVSYLLGRGPGGRLLAGTGPRAPGGAAVRSAGRSAGRVRARREAALAWARRTVDRRGGLILVVARYVPGGRTAVTVTMGAVRWPLRSFTPFAALAAVTWALYGGLLGFAGGAAFEHDPIRGVALGVGLAVTLTVVVESVRCARGRRARSRRRGTGERPGGQDGPVETGGARPLPRGGREGQVRSSGTRPAS